MHSKSLSPHYNSLPGICLAPSQAVIGDRRKLSKLFGGSSTQQARKQQALKGERQAPNGKPRVPIKRKPGLTKKISGSSLWATANKRVTVLVHQKIVEARRNERTFFVVVKAAMAVGKRRRECERERIEDEKVQFEREACLDEQKRLQDEQKRLHNDEQKRLHNDEQKRLHIDEQKQLHNDAEQLKEVVDVRRGKAHAQLTGGGNPVGTTLVLALKSFKELIKEKQQKEAEAASRANELARLQKRRRARQTLIRRVEAEMDEQPVSEVTEYAEFSSRTGDKLKMYEYVWCTRCQYGLDQHVSAAQFKVGLQKLHKELITDSQWEFCMRALDIVHDASHHECPYNFRMFSTLAMLYERVASLEHILEGKIDEIDFANGKGLEHKLLESRKLFYLGAIPMTWLLLTRYRG